MLAATAPAVLRVTASGCGGSSPDRAASGFAYGSGDQVVTAFHVVQGCGSISVGYQGITELPAHVTHVLQDADLALLQVESGGANVTPLVETDRAGDVNEVLHVYGFALGQATRENRRLIVTAANEGWDALGQLPWMRKIIALAIWGALALAIGLLLWE